MPKIGLIFLDLVYYKLMGTQKQTQGHIKDAKIDLRTH